VDVVRALTTAGRLDDHRNEHVISPLQRGAAGQPAETVAVGSVAIGVASAAPGLLGWVGSGVSGVSAETADSRSASMAPAATAAGSGGDSGPPPTWGQA